MPTAAFEGQEIFYRTGRVTEPVDGRGIVFVHGAGGNGMIWHSQRRTLGEGAFCAALDLPGHGRSGGRPADSVDAYADLVTGFLDAVGLARATVVGHSMGGAVAQTLALTRPDRVEALVLMSTGARLRVAEAILIGLRETPDLFCEQFETFAFGPGADPDSVALVLEGFDPAVALPDFLACNRFDRISGIEQIGVPTCVIVGEADLLTPVKYSRHLADHIEGARLHVVESAGHMVMLEAGEEVNRILAAFLTSS